MAKRSDTLARYRAKRDFTKTPEPAGKAAKAAGHRYLIQKHAATRLHYDFRLELDGTLKSWAVTRGPSLDPHDKRLAVEVEDHPVEYGSFEGIIPKGQYGGGTVMLWDEGSWEPIGDPHQGLADGKLTFNLHGKRLKGEWTLVRMHTKDEKRNNWLLIKHSDDEAKLGDNGQLLADNTTSIKSGRSMEEIAAAQDRVWQSKAANTNIPVPRPPAKKAKYTLPRFIAPQLATLSEEMPKGDGWVHEIKFDGYRALSYVNAGQARIFTRTGKDWTDIFAPIARALKILPADAAILDGEIVALDEHAASSFRLLQEVLHEGKKSELQYYVFDLLYLDGKRLTGLPLAERKEKLRALLAGMPAPVFYSEDFSGYGNDFLQRICRLEMEGVISKRSDAPYRPGRGTAWLKSKCHHRQEFVIGGFTLPSDKGRGIGALALGYYEGKTLHYAGRVGTGFSAALSRDIRKQLEARRQEKMPFASVPADGRRGALWVKPELVCEVEFTEWTRDGRLRHPSFQGLRDDKPASAIKRDEPVASPSKEDKIPPMAKRKQSGKGGADVGGITITHPDRVIFPDNGITKGELAEYYHQVAEHILPHIKERPLSMIRCPEGISEPCFFQRHIARGQSPHFYDAPVGIKGRQEIYLMIKDEKGLLSLAQWGVIELHPWGCRADKPEMPDRIIFDLDPDPAADWRDVIDAAKEVRTRLKELGLVSFLKTTGGKGLHVTAPIARQYSWKPVKAFTRAIAESMVQDNPKRYIATASKAARKGKVFVDYLRNDMTATAIAPFSVRARAGAPVAMPLSWEELKAGLQPAKFTMETAPARLQKQKQDPWEEFFTLRQKIPASHFKALNIRLD